MKEGLPAKLMFRLRALSVESVGTIRSNLLRFRGAFIDRRTVVPGLEIIQGMEAVGLIVASYPERTTVANPCVPWKDGWR